MIAVGIDIGKRMHQACFLDGQGREIGRALRFASTTTGIQQLQARLQALNQPLTIALEASGHYWLPLQRQLSAAGWTVQVINPLQTEAFRTSGIRKTKTDRRDAFVIADLLRVGRTRPNSVPDDRILHLRELTRFRWHLVDRGGDAKRRLLTVLDRIFPEFADQFTDPFGISARTLLREAASAGAFAALDLDDLTARLAKASRGRFGRAKAQALHQCAQESVALTALGTVGQVEVTALLDELALLDRHVQQVDTAIAALLDQHPHHLTAIPGIGPVLAATILAEIGDIHRFPRLAALVAYAGIDPGVFASGSLHGTRQHVSKRGSPSVRRALFLAAHSAHPRNPDLAASVRRKLAAGKPYRVVIVALAHRLLARIYVILTEDRPYAVR
jgi:transposase